MRAFIFTCIIGVCDRCENAYLLVHVVIIKLLMQRTVWRVYFIAFAITISHSLPYNFFLPFSCSFVLFYCTSFGDEYRTYSASCHEQRFVISYSIIYANLWNTILVAPIPCMQKKSEDKRQVVDFRWRDWPVILLTSSPIENVRCRSGFEMNVDVHDETSVYDPPTTSQQTIIMTVEMRQTEWRTDGRTDETNNSDSS